MTLRLALVLEFDLRLHAPKNGSKAIGSRFRGDNGPFGGNPQGSTDHIDPIANPVTRRARNCGWIKTLRFEQLHRLIVRATATFRRNPGDVAIRILDVAGFAVDAVLRVDDE